MIPMMKCRSAKRGDDGRTLPAGDAAEAFDPAEFVARVIMHIPEPRRHLVRYLYRNA